MKLGKTGATERLKKNLTEQIQAGILLPGAPILSATELARLYKISYPTVHRVLTEMAHEGMLYRIQGRGTFVATRDKKKQSEGDGVGVFMRSEGDLFGPMFSQVCDSLQSAGLLCIASDVFTHTFTKIPERCIADVLKSNPIAFIVEGLAQFPFDAIKKHEKEISHLVYIHLLQTDWRFNADAVLSDFERGGYLAARHLLELGHRRLAFELYGTPESTNPAFQYHRDKLRGARLACQEFGISAEGLLVLPPMEEPVAEKTLRDILRRSDAPTALIAASDYQASKMLTVLNSLGLRVPEDVSLIGYFNTPWCGRLGVALSSVSIREDVIAKRAVDCVCEKIADPDAPRIRLLLEPELVVRDSTALVRKAVSTARFRGTDHRR